MLLNSLEEFIKGENLEGEASVLAIEGPQTLLNSLWDIEIGYSLKQKDARVGKVRVIVFTITKSALALSCPPNNGI